MTEPNIAGKKSVFLELEPGEYWWCACGHSANQPFCDGSHKAYGFTPVNFTITEKKTVKLCMCKHTKNKPFCDGTHKTL